MITTMFFQYYNYYTRQTHQVEKLRFSDQVMLFLAICIIYAITLLTIFVMLEIFHERIIYKYFVTQSNHTANIHNRLNIHARPPRRWSGPTYKRKTNAVKRRVKSGVKRGFICGINGYYRDEPSSSEFSDLNNGSNGNFGI